MNYVKYENILLKIGSDRPEFDIKSTEIIVTNPSYELLEHYLKQYVYEYFGVFNPNLISKIDYNLFFNNASG